jgi:hypothetical protein
MITIAFLTGCSANEPRIVYHYLSLNWFAPDAASASKTPYPRLTFFVLPEDNDGFEDIDELRLYNDAAGLYWTVKNADWKTVKAGENTWIGAYDLAMPDNAQPPSGQYRAVIIDKSGEQSEKTFGFDYEAGRHEFPAFTVNLDMQTFSIDTTYPDLRLICFDTQGNEVGAVNVEARSGPLNTLRLPGNARSAALWAEDPAYFTSARTGIQAVR